MDEDSSSTSAAAKRDVEARATSASASSSMKALPTYATDACDAAKYASACGCYGVTAGVTTAPASTVTMTTTMDYCDDL